MAARASDTPAVEAFRSWTFGSALGELRGTFGVHVAKIAAEFRLDVEDKLAAILPANADADTGDDDRLLPSSVSLACLFEKHTGYGVGMRG